MTCHNCKIEAVKAGKDRKGNQRFRCNKCKRRFQPERERLLGNMNISEEKALLSLQLLLEGMSLRSVERTTGVNMHTLLSLLELAGERCERLMTQRIKGVAVKDVEADEIWAFVGCKNRHKLHKQITDPKVGDATRLSESSATPNSFSLGTLASEI
jgi:transposase-like protein